jgi:hypothetical protein
MTSIAATKSSREDMRMIAIQDALRGCETGRMQTVGIMQVIPLVSDLETDAFARPSEIRIATGRGGSYGTMNFRNSADKPALVPVHATYLTKQMAQDHAMATGGFVPARKEKAYKNAQCVEQSQGGYIPEGSHPLTILPLSLRETSLSMRGVASYSKLWESISRLKKEAKVTGGRSGGHLADFFAAFDKQLAEFVAEFELVTGQVGAIVLIGGEVVGVERAPSRAYWEDLWEPLIRTCYGSEAVRRTRMGKAVTPRTNQVRAVRDLDDLVAALSEARANDEGSVRDIVRTMVQDPFKATPEEKLGVFDLETVENDQFTGQIVREGPRVHYVSVTARASFAKHEGWHKAKAFTV